MTTTDETDTEAMEPFWIRHLPTRLRRGRGEFEKPSRMIEAARLTIAVPLSAWRNKIVSRAAALSFTTMISLIPLAVLVFSTIAIFDGGERINAFIQQRIIPILAPDFATHLTEYIRDNISPTALRRSVADWPGIVALVGLVLAALQITSLSERYLNAIWKTESKRTFLQRLGVFWIVLTISPFVLFFMMQLGDLVASLPWMDGGASPWLAATHGFALPLVCGFLTFFAVFRVFPHTPVKTKSAVLGALLSTVLWETARRLFFLYIERQSGMTSFYPKLATIPLFLIWIWINWVITLLGCECAHAVQNLESVWVELAALRGSERPSRTILALKLLSALITAHRSAASPPDDVRLATSTGSTPDEVVAVFRLLESKGFVVETARGRRWVLACSPEIIRLADVWELAQRPHRNSNRSRMRADIDALRAERAAIDAFGDRTLADYANDEGNESTDDLSHS